MLMSDEWSQACDEVVATLLAQADLGTPPFEMFELAERLDMGIAWDARQTGRGRLMRLNGDPAIFLRPEQRPERLQWATAHEIGETIAWKVAQRLGIDPGELLPRQREGIANQLANRLLLPHPWWRDAMKQTGQDILQLKERFPNASHELIAWRLLDACDPKIITIIDNGTVARRRSNFTFRCPSVTDDERSCWERARARACAEAACDRVRGLLPGDVPAHCRAWAIHEAGWQREIVITWVEVGME